VVSWNRKAGEVPRIHARPRGEEGETVTEIELLKKILNEMEIANFGIGMITGILVALFVTAKR
jgi:hypothetical protein